MKMAVVTFCDNLPNILGNPRLLYRRFGVERLTKANHDKPSEIQARLSREPTERGRALELIRRKKREMEGNLTPSTVSNDSG